MRYFVKVYYDGRNYYGYQRQPNLVTIEGEIINALVDTNHIDNAEESNFRSASRTDRSVSAVGNVFAFDSKKSIIIDQINAVCSKDKSIICWAYGEVEKNLSPKYSKWKKYWYLLPFEFIKKEAKLTLEEIKNISSIFIGKHDFKLFCKVDHRNTQREIYQINIIKEMNEIIFEFIAPSFLWEQVRRIMAYILNYKTLSDNLQRTKELLVIHCKAERLDIMPANPSNLVLVEHLYNNIKWNENKKSIAMIRNKIKKHLKEFKQEISLNSAIHDFFENKV
ncbi:MAG: hypothetical protein V3V41_02450 [Candidatus Heimdallarchaeota archaeon]